jgi:hypothetical protein
MKSMIMALLFLASGCYCEFNGYLSMANKPPVDALSIDDPWKRLYFTTIAPTRYEFTTTEYTFLELVDLHCQGDQFGVFDHDSLLGSTTEVREEAGCKESIEDPNEAPKGGWSNGKFFLPKGKHNITIVVLKSPFNEGAAAIRLTPALSPSIY